MSRKKSSSSTERGGERSRRWRLWQVESSFACNLRCVMCPWQGKRAELDHTGHMDEGIWRKLIPYLNQVKSIDFSGGGEPLLQKNLLQWLACAREQGCETGVLTNGTLVDEVFVKGVEEIGLNWLGFSIDGADRESYERIRQGGSFAAVCDNVKKVTSLRDDRRPWVMINYVIMTTNCDQLEEIVCLAAKLGADQVNFKQCDVIRGSFGRGLGLHRPYPDADIKRCRKLLRKAGKIAKKEKIRLTSFSFLPDELPVCDQDPRDSLFVSHDGHVAPCINLAMGGDSTFMGEKCILPELRYGSLVDADLEDIWQGLACKTLRQRFNERIAIHDSVLATADLGHDLIKLNQAFRKAQQAMPPPPHGCTKCHYLYGV